MFRNWLDYISAMPKWEWTYVPTVERITCGVCGAQGPGAATEVGAEWLAKRAGWEHKQFSVARWITRWLWLCPTCQKEHAEP